MIRLFLLLFVWDSTAFYENPCNNLPSNTQNNSFNGPHANIISNISNCYFDKPLNTHDNFFLFDSLEHGLILSIIPSKLPSNTLSFPTTVISNSSTLSPVITMGWDDIWSNHLCMSDDLY